MDSAPLTIAANDHRPAYASDGDYFSKPSVDDMVEKIYAVFHEANPSQFQKFKNENFIFIIAAFTLSSCAVAKIQDCPEEKIINKMPKVIDGNSQTPNEYYIYKGERRGNQGI